MPVPQPERAPPRPPSTAKVPTQRRPEDADMLNDVDHLLDEIDAVLDDNPIPTQKGGQ